MTDPSSLRAKLIFNPQAGSSDDSAQQLSEIVGALRSQQIQPDVFHVHPNSRIDLAVRRAIRAGIQLIIIAGGDGTIDAAVPGMVGASAALGIIPIGTRNNVALSLKIPASVPEAAALLRSGHRRWIDVGHVRCGRASRWFLEALSLGLLSMLYPAADDVQHGNPARVADLLATFTASTPARLSAILDGREQFDTTVHTALVVNMPFIGPNFQIAPDVACDDGFLDFFAFHNMGKLDLLAYATKWLVGPPQDDNVKHFRARQIILHAAPPLPVLIDGVLIGEGLIKVEVKPRGLQVIGGLARARDAAVQP